MAKTSSTTKSAWDEKMHSFRSGGGSLKIVYSSQTGSLPPLSERLLSSELSEAFQRSFAEKDTSYQLVALHNKKGIVGCAPFEYEVWADRIWVPHFTTIPKIEGVAEFILTALAHLAHIRSLDLVLERDVTPILPLASWGLEYQTHLAGNQWWLSEPRLSLFSEKASMLSFQTSA